MIFKCEVDNMIKIAKTHDIPEGEVRSFVVDNEMVAVFNINNEYYALKDQCSHMELPLSDGLVDGDKVTCAYHGAEFEIKTGKVLCPPAVEPVENYKVMIEGDDIYIDL